jgi:hypothetical protein
MGFHKLIMMSVFFVPGTQIAKKSKIYGIRHVMDKFSTLAKQL